jgi:hypothetical protein
MSITETSGHQPRWLRGLYPSPDGNVRRSPAYAYVGLVVAIVRDAMPGLNEDLDEKQKYRTTFFNTNAGLI